MNELYDLKFIGLVSIFSFVTYVLYECYAELFILDHDYEYYDDDEIIDELVIDNSKSYEIDNTFLDISTYYEPSEPIIKPIIEPIIYPVIEPIISNKSKFHNIFKKFNIFHKKSKKK